MYACPSTSGVTVLWSVDTLSGGPLPSARWHGTPHGALPSIGMNHFDFSSSSVGMNGPPSNPFPLLPQAARGAVPGWRISADEHARPAGCHRPAESCDCGGTCVAGGEGCSGVSRARGRGALSGSCRNVPACVRAHRQQSRNPMLPHTESVPATTCALIHGHTTKQNISKNLLGVRATAGRERRDAAQREGPPIVHDAVVDRDQVPGLQLVSVAVLPEQRDRSRDADRRLTAADPQVIGREPLAEIDLVESLVVDGPVRFIGIPGAAGTTPGPRRRFASCAAGPGDR